MVSKKFFMLTEEDFSHPADGCDEAISPPLDIGHDAVLCYIGYINPSSRGFFA